MKRGVILLNLGGPTDTKHVKPFLFRLFSDPDILVGMPGPVRLLLAFLISRVKGSHSIKMYEKIGGCSPQYCWSILQAQDLQAALRKEGEDVEVVVGMRAWKPTIGDALERLRASGVEEVILLPLFPQFSTTTTGSCFKEAHRLLRKMGWSPKVREIRSWPDHPAYIHMLEKVAK